MSIRLFNRAFSQSPKLSFGGKFWGDSGPLKTPQNFWRVFQLGFSRLSLQNFPPKLSWGVSRLGGLTVGQPSQKLGMVCSNLFHSCPAPRLFSTSHDRTIPRSPPTIVKLAPGMVRRTRRAGQSQGHGQRFPAVPKLLVLLRPLLHLN